ncbi:MAG: nondiscriminating aspartyl-tRNA synthetase [Candidatus Methanomethylophilaceae archaeon]|nr:nondiscriminating aspartyl-tRNA synthetase [Candidatus Methanomethylophilaceae archaeon]MDI3541924.1 nondiscriminating aspartyl-tRNA synthetase [Candidatus Methanomethylophilaceae archaeon]HIJ00301.1 aspartate--tRNA(Asn) ligase [Candidatus Methanomethylophilaceae archaeon]
MAYPVRDSTSISIDDGTVTVRGWVQEIRNLGGISFILIRDRNGIIQITAPKKKINPDLFKQLTSLSRESVVSVSGEVKTSDQTKLGLEIIPLSLEIHSVAESPLPLGVVDKVNVEFDTRLNHRFMDLRKPEVKAIFELKSLLCKLISEKMAELDFMQVQTPKIVATGAEGGATLFPIEYFDKKAYLAQSPQLYKQMLMSTGMDRVYEIAPAFRAERSNTVRHVSEFISFDGELAWIRSQKDVMAVIEEVMQYTISGIASRGTKYLEVIGAEVTIPKAPYPILSYSECLDMLMGEGMEISEGEDFGTEGERLIGEIMSLRGNDMYWIVEYPKAEKPFYIMEKEGTAFSYSFDLDYRGQEISSGGQREHRYERLVTRMKAKGLNPESFGPYLESFRYGMPPHGGWGIGVERLLVNMLGLNNIREAILFPRDVHRLIP